MKIVAADLKSPPAVLASGWMHIRCKMRSGVIQQLMHIQVTQEPPPLEVVPRIMHTSHIDPLTGQDDEALPAPSGSAPIQGTFARDRDRNGLSDNMQGRLADAERVLDGRRKP